jgi:hypothetical protein
MQAHAMLEAYGLAKLADLIQIKRYAANLFDLNQLDPKAHI